MYRPAKPCDTGELVPARSSLARQRRLSNEVDSAPGHTMIPEQQISMT